MILSRLSIQYRLTFLVGIFIALIISSLTATSLIRAANSNELVKARITETLHNATEQRLLVEADLQSQSLRNFFISAFKEGQDLAFQVSEIKRLASKRTLPPEALREELVSVTTNKLKTNPDLLSMYVVFKPNALDASDSSFRQRPDMGSNEIGRFAYYASQSNNSSFSMATPEQTINDLTPGLDGTPFRSWFDCPINTAEPCLLHPYFDDSSGKKILITTLSFPIIESGEVVGVAGLDISLDKLQALADQAAPLLYEGSSTISILTPAGLVAGASSQPGLLGKRFDNNEQPAITDAKNRFGTKSHVFSDDAWFSVVRPTMPIPGSALWSIVIRVPKAKVFAPALALQDELDSQSSSNLVIELLVGLIAGALGVIFIWFTARGVSQPLLSVAHALKNIAGGGGDLTRRVNYGSRDELGQLCSWFNHFLEMLQPLIRDIQRLAKEANHTAQTSSVVATDLDSGMQRQFSEVDQVATASQELSSSALDVASSAAQAAQATRDAEKSAQQGLAVIAETSGTIQTLAKSLEEAMAHTQGLTDRSQKIGSVLQVIHSIAEQTNLLALNAAIEAARAGESGRGFAVVADEVRNLAKHTRDSVDEIRDVIETLQLSTHDVYSAMQTGILNVAEGVRKVSIAACNFNEIGSAITVINEMTLQIASAAAQQSSVAEDVCRSVATIRDVTEILLAKSRQSQTNSQTLSAQADEQKKLVDLFQT